MNGSRTCERAKSLMVGPFDWPCVPVEEVIRRLQVSLYVASLGEVPQCPINLVYADTDEYTTLVTLCTDGPKPLAEILELVADEAALTVSYYPSGIVLAPMPTEEHVDEPSSLQNTAEANDPTGYYPGKLSAGFDAPAPVEPSPLPAPLAPPDSATLREIADDAWKQTQAEILRLYPQIGVAGSTANQTFIRAFQRAGNDPRKAVQVAQAMFEEPLSPTSSPPVRVVTFLGGPADGLAALVDDSLDTAYLAPPGYDGVWYTVPDGENVSRFVGWAKLKG